MLRQQISAFILAVSALSWIGGQAFAQEGEQAAAAKASGELRLLIAFRDMERALSEMDHFLNYGIVSSTGGWGVLDFVDTTDYTNSYVLRGKVGDVQVVAARANASIQRSKIATDEWKERAEGALTNFEHILTAANEIADALTAEEFAKAGEIYRDKCEDLYEQALRDLQAGALEIEKQLGKTLIDIRLAK